VIVNNATVLAPERILHKDYPLFSGRLSQLFRWKEPLPLNEVLHQLKTIVNNNNNNNNNNNSKNMEVASLSNYSKAWLSYFQDSKQLPKV